MKGRLARLVLCAALLTPAVAPGLAVAEEKKANALKLEERKDLDYAGSITAIDAAAGKVTVKHKQQAPMTFSVAKDCMLFVRHKKGAASLSDFKVGEEVEVLYRQDGDTLVCHGMWQPGSNPREKEHKIQKQSQTP